ncbi:hypothetical protein Tco_1373482, partial [Tanacetum coccineum]
VPVAVEPETLPIQASVEALPVLVSEIKGLMVLHVLNLLINGGGLDLNQWWRRPSLKSTPGLCIYGCLGD